MTLRNWHQEHKNGLTTGERAADLLRNGMGSWWFIGIFALAMSTWAVINSVALANASWDPYPYILLNLFLSMLAGLQGAILLIAAKRQDAISSAMAQHDFDTNVAAKSGIDHLIELNEQNYQRISELRDLVDEINQRVAVIPVR